MKKQLLHPDTMLVTGLVMFVFMIASFVLAYSGVLSEQFGKREGSTCVTAVRTCPDGSTIVRRGPSCEFSKCQPDALPNRPGIVEAPFVIPTPPEEQGSKKKKNAILCTQEVKMCSDGSFVGRSGPNCEFAPCPSNLELESDR